MIIFVQLVLLALVSFSVLPTLVLVIVPLFYIWSIGRGLIKGGEAVDAAQLTNALAERWKNPQELAEYMVRYWPALKYSSSATARQHSCMSLAIIQIGVGLIVLWKASIIIGLAMLVEGVFLWAMAGRVNRPLSIYKDSRLRIAQEGGAKEEWRLAVLSLVAYSELYPENPTAKYLALRLLNDELAQTTVNDVRSKGWGFATV